MKHLFLYAGVAFIGYTLWKKNQTANPANTSGLTPPTGISVSPATLVVPGAIGGTNAAGSDCSPCNQIAGLGGDAAITASPQQNSPSAVTHSVMREDYESINPFSPTAY